MKSSSLALFVSLSTVLMLAGIAWVSWCIAACMNFEERLKANGSSNSENSEEESQEEELLLSARRRLMMRNSDPKSVTLKDSSTHGVFLRTVVETKEGDDSNQELSENTESAPASSMTYTQCRANLTINTFPQLHEWTQNSLPLLQSVVKDNNGFYNSIVLVRHLKDFKMWASKRWLCHSAHDGRPNPIEAVLMNPERNSKFEILVLQCPAKDFTALTVIVEDPGGRRVYQEYDVRPFLECEELYQPQNPPVQTAACTQIRGAGPSGMLEEWIEYHRLVGFQHFWIYVNDDPSVIANLPQRDYITYIPYNYCLCHHNEDNMFSNAWWTVMPIFQTPVMGECIWRARNEGIRWLALHDVDEYFQVVDDQTSNNTTVIDYIETLPFKDEVGGIIVNSIPFGLNPATDDRQKIELTMDYAWRKNYTVNKPTADRLKLIVHPERVNQVGVHFIHSGDAGKMVEYDTQLRLLHYKKAERGVFKGHGDIVRDDSLAKSTLRDQVYERVKGG